MKYQVDGWNNFCMVFRLPQEYPQDFCFGGGHAVNFQMVDWFNPIPDIGQPAVSKEAWREKVGEIEVTEVDHDDTVNLLVPWLREKQYVKEGRDYLVICNFGMSFIFNKEEKVT